MGLKEKKHKEKNKRKRGKKYKYDPEKDKNNNNVLNTNPFEAFSQKKFQKKNNSFSQLISEYQSKNVVNSFKDKRIAENSNLSYDEKMKLRYKAQQLLKKTKKARKILIMKLNLHIKVKKQMRQIQMKVLVKMIIIMMMNIMKK